MKNSRNRGSGWRTLGVEVLEDRKLLAGNVTVTLRGGLLTIEGDNEANNIALYQQADGKFNLFGSDGVTFTGPTTNLAIRNLTVNLNGGDDSLTVAGPQNPLSLDSTPAQIVGVTNVNGGAGVDYLKVNVIGRTAGTLLIPATSLTIDGGSELSASRDFVIVQNSAAALVTVKTWTGDDFINMINVHALTMSLNSGVPGNVNGPTDNDFIALGGLTAVASTINLGTSSVAGPGNDVLTIEDGLFGSLTVNGSAGLDNVQISNSLVGSSLTVNTFGGTDYLYLDTTQTGMTRADYQAVAQQLTTTFGIDIAQLPFNLFGLINALPTLPGVMTINTGDGDDFVSMTDMSSTFSMYVFLDRGNDQLQATNITATLSLFYGGPGIDSRLLNSIDGFFLDLQFEDTLPPLVF